jgi:hypothetical protein
MICFTRSLLKEVHQDDESVIVFIVKAARKHCVVEWFRIEVGRIVLLGLLRYLDVVRPKELQLMNL